MRQKTWRQAPRGRSSRPPPGSRPRRDDAERVGARDVALLLDGVAVGDAVGRAAGREHHLDLGDRGGVEAGAEPGQQLQHLGRRIGLHGVEHAGVRQRLGEGLVVLAHDVEIDDEAGPVPAASRRLRRNSRMRVGHGALLTKVKGGTRIEFRRRTARRQRVRDCALPCDGDTTARRVLHPTMLPWIGAGDSRSARPARMDKPLRCRPLEGRRDQRSPFRRCFKPRPPLSAGYAGFASGCRSSVLSDAAIRSASPPGGCPASCPDAHRSTHGHRHVRNRAVRHISDLNSLSSKNRRREENLGAQRARMANSVDVERDALWSLSPSW